MQAISITSILIITALCGLMVYYYMKPREYDKPLIGDDGRIRYTPEEASKIAKPGEHVHSFGYPSDYYDDAKCKKGTVLREAIKEIITKDHVEISYDEIWDMCADADQNPNNSSQIWEIYLQQGCDASEHWSGGEGWNREHIWAKSHGDFGTKKGPGTDCHHLRPADGVENSKRNNLNFCTVDGARTYDDECYEPPLASKGDVARAIFYMAVRWSMTVDNSGSRSKDPRIGKLDSLLEWTNDDPVDDYEINRNNIIYTSYQFNRNPFIDHPELVDYIFGSKTDEEWDC